MSSFILQHIASTVGIQLYTTETQCDIIEKKSTISKEL